jgi:hypothetical protein
MGQSRPWAWAGRRGEGRKVLAGNAEHAGDRFGLRGSRITEPQVKHDVPGGHGGKEELSAQLRTLSHNYQLPDSRHRDVSGRAAVAGHETHVFKSHLDPFLSPSPGASADAPYSP